MNIRIFYPVLLVIILSPVIVGARTIDQNQNFETLLKGDLSNFEKYDVLATEIEVNLNLNVDRSVDTSIKIIKTLDAVPNSSVFIFFKLSESEKYDNIVLFDLSKNEKIEKVPALDLSICDGKWMYNQNLNQILACSYENDVRHVKTKIEYTILPEEIDECFIGEPDRSFHNISLPFSIDDNYTYPITIRVNGDESLILLKPGIPNTSLELEYSEIESGFIIKIPPQEFNHNYLLLDQIVVGLFRDEFIKKGDVIGRYKGQITASTILSIVLIFMSFTQKKIDPKSKKYDIGIIVIELGTTLILGKIVVNNFTTIYQDVSKGYIGWWAILPSVIGLLGIIFAYYVLLKEKNYRNLLSWLR